jgi:ammonium transporter, Amt family
MPKLLLPNGSRLRWLLASVLIMALLAMAAPAFAQDGTPPDNQALSDAASDAAVGLNVTWVLLCSFLIFFMQAGFALVEAGFTRAKNAAHTMTMNMMVFCLGAVGYWLTGFALQFGGVNHTYPALGAALPAWNFAPVTLGAWTSASGAALLDKPLLIGGSGFMGLTGFILGGLSANMGVLVYFIMQMVFMDTAATIPTGSMAERMKFSGFALMSMWVSMFIYPLIGNWVWGGGWLANLGRSAGLGNGAVDFAGSGVVHLVGGSIALAGALVLGPRMGKFNQDGSANTIPGHNLPMGVLGTIILFFGWFGFNPGSSLGMLGGFRSLAVLAAINTLLAGAAGGVSAMLCMWCVHRLRKPDPAMSVNGALAGLVAITAPCAFVTPAAAVLIGLCAGVLVCYASALLEKLKIDDPVGAIPVHFANGLFGVLAVGIFANGNPDTALWNGVATPVTGLLYGGTGQFLAQLAEAVAIPAVAFSSSLVVFKVMAHFRLLRVSREVELAGLDMPEMGAEGYPKDWEPSPEALGLPQPRAVPAGLAAAAGD